MSGLSVPGYEIKGVLGRGGFGVVYLALQSAVGREVALKVDNRLLLSDHDRRRFLREVTAAGALTGHPHVVPVYDAGVLPDGRPYLVLEPCPGGSLSGRLLSPPDVRDVGVRVADALAAAHAQGVLHRDVKPANLLINRYGQVALSDFGLAAMPSAGPAAGLSWGSEAASVTRESPSAAYAPPEAFELTEPTPAGDVYALAATLYTLLTGRPPRFPEGGAPNLAMILALHRRPVPDVPGVPDELMAVLREALATDPRRRTPSAAAFRDALSALPLSPLSAQSPLSAPSEVPAAHPTGRAPESATERAAGGATERVTGRAAGRATGGAMERATERATRRASGRAPERAAEPAGRGTPRTLLLGAAAVALAVAVSVIVTVRPGVAEPTDRTKAAAQPTRTPAPTPAPTLTPARPATHTENCPAARIRGGGAACLSEPECWAARPAATGGSAAAGRLSCAEPHAWETFAIAPVPANSRLTPGLARHPTVRRVCSRTVLLATRTTAARRHPANAWTVKVMPPSRAQFAAGVRDYRCLGRLTGEQETRGTFFHRTG
ncbi:protein kinase [Nonomuraea sp. NN258]|uniref:serine/threonine-protein kinase n=1 Tax=Nonomuraea antri TaxID=2730852 RepID=UPI0015685649|nr:serine/threonine-protein kinase [Nonomuraea antri]NRQ35664.1 protein kinase [Nonomuraea antri]